MARRSVALGIPGIGVREKQAPALVAPHGFQADQCLVARCRPELTGAFEPALILSASGLHRSRANGIACLGNGFIIEAALVRQKVIPFYFHGFVVFRTIDDLLK